ncbi:hypothetical protein BC833DRAFT_612435 [Globomyces pollinis-pini]|nr:hypothetical protein BC833DRAFT_612435 [Globomyces pollinis-pini]
MSSNTTDTIRYATPPTYTTSLDYIALSLVILNFTATLILLFVSISKKIKIMADNQLYKLICLLTVSLIWQFFVYWAYFLQGHPYTRYTVTFLGAALALCTILFQSTILSHFCISPISKQRICMFQKLFGALSSVTFIVMLIRIPTYATVTPPWLYMVCKCLIHCSFLR